MGNLHKKKRLFFGEIKVNNVLSTNPNILPNVLPLTSEPEVFIVTSTQENHNYSIIVVQKL